MAAWRYEISLLVLKKYFTSERSERVKYFSTLEEKFRIFSRPCNILYVLVSYSGIPVLFTLEHALFIRRPNLCLYILRL